MIVTATNGKIYRHDEDGLKALQAEHPDVYAKVVKNKPEKAIEQPKKKSKKAIEQPKKKSKKAIEQPKKKSKKASTK